MKRIIIIGGVAGGMSAATRLRRLDPDASIIVLERSGYVSYANCGLPYHLGGVITEERSLLLQTPESLHARFRLDVRTLAEVTAIDRHAQTVTVADLEGGSTYQLPYDYVIMSPGAQPVIPAIPGIHHAMTLRTIEDVQRIASAVNSDPADAVVIGGGFIGVESAENLLHRGIPTTVVESSSQVLAPLDPEMASPVAEEMRRHGINLILGDSAAEIGPDYVLLASGTRIPSQLTLLAIGVRPDTALAAACGLDIGPRGGIKTDSDGLTSDPRIFAIGDAAEKVDALDGESSLVPLANVANRQGRRAADLIMGRKVRSVATQATAIVKVFDLAVASSGWNEKRLRAAGRDVIALHSHPGSHAGYYPGASPMHLKLLVDPFDGTILGVQGIGRDGVDKRIDVIATAMRAGLTAPQLADLELAYAPPFGSAKDPVNMLGYMAENLLEGDSPIIQWYAVAEAQTAGVSVIDVRSAGEFRRGHIPGSINIPLDELRERMGEIGPAPQSLVVSCQVGQRGHTASLLLRQHGFDARNLDGGYLTWLAGQSSIDPGTTR